MIDKIFKKVILFSVTFFFFNIFLFADSFKVMDPMQVVKEMDPGINLGNTLDAIPNEDSWGNGGTTEETIQGFKKSGFNSLRIPVTWFPHTGSGPDYKIDPKWMDRVEEIVDWALKAGLYVVLNVHHDSWEWMNVMAIDPVTGKYVNDSKTYIPRLEKLWVQIAERFKDKDEHLIFEILNEPNKGDWEPKDEKPANPKAPAKRHDLPVEEMNEINLRILKVIRHSGGNNDKRLVMFCPRGNSAEDALLPEFQIPPSPYDKNLILTVHDYGPWHFVSSWWGKYTWGSDEEKKEAEAIYPKLYEKFCKKGIPVVIGEWGAFGRCEKFSRWYYYDFHAKIYHKYNMAGMWWDTGGDYLRKTQSWKDPILKEIIVNQAKGIVNSFVLCSDAYIKAGEPLHDLTLPLELNGNTLSGIEINGEKISKTDYSIDPSGNSVTISKNILKKYVNLKKIGINAVLKFDFSQGIDQPVNIVVYDIPVVSKKSITLKKSQMYIAEDIVIPTKFNGMKIAAVKVTTLKDNKPCKESWTPYVNEGDDYDYNKDSIILKFSILSRIKEDSRFVFEFWPKGPTNELQVKFIDTTDSVENKLSGKTLINFQSDKDLQYVKTKEPVKVSKTKILDRDCLKINVSGLNGWSQDYLNITGLNDIRGADWQSAKGLEFMIYIDEKSDFGTGYAQLMPVLQSSMNYWMPLSAVDLKNVPKNRWVPVTIPVKDPQFIDAMSGVFQIIFIFNSGSPIDAVMAIDDIGYTTKIE